MAKANLRRAGDEKGHEAVVHKAETSGTSRPPRRKQEKKKKKDKGDDDGDSSSPPKAKSGQHFSNDVDDGTKRALGSFDDTSAGKVSKDLDGKPLGDVKSHMDSQYPDAVKTETELRTPRGQSGKVVQTKWELEDGTVVRVKETDPIGGKVDRFRGEPALSVSSMKRDSSGNPLPDSFSNEAFKVSPDGTPIPKRPADVDVSGLSSADKAARIDYIMNAGHRSIER